jgi:hypothetical protein
MTPPAFNPDVTNGPSQFTEASGATETVWPPNLDEVFPARLLGSKAFIKIYQILGVILHIFEWCQKKQPESIEYPLSGDTGLKTGFDSVMGGAI